MSERKEMATIEDSVVTKGLHTWQTQSTLDAGEEEANLTHSSKTICPPTPVNELSLENPPKDATTPVLPVPLSPPPLSPRTKCFDAETQQSKQPVEQKEMKPQDQQAETNHFSRRPRSYRDLSRNRRGGLKKNYGMVIGDFIGLYVDELTIRVGEKIEIISKDTMVSRNIGWWTGRDDRGKIGIFPAACVSVEGSTSNGSDEREVSVGEYSLGINSKDVEMKEVVGIGGFGKVYRAIYQGEEVAVKVAKTTTFDSLKAVQEVIGEAEKFAHLAHNNVCALVGVVLVKDVCLIMEYARGGALSELLHKRGVSLPVGIILDWALQIVDGMNYLHNVAQPSLIHRDLKSSNILLATEVDPQNLEGNVIKITDFGLAREIEHTTHMSGAGTYPWMAPEVIRSSDFSKKSDVWSFGVVLWELLTGKRPYDGLNLFVVAYGVGHGTIKLPIPDGCPQPIATLLDVCWDRVHSNRPTFTDILNHLRRYRAEELFSASNEEFFTMQSTWRQVIQDKFNQLKKHEQELQSKERSLQQRILEQQEKEKQLDREKEEVKIKAERLEMLIKQLSQQQSQDDTAKEETDSQPCAGDDHTHYQDVTVPRPPRLKPFSFRTLIKKLWNDRTGTRGRKVEGPLPSKVGTGRTTKTTKRMLSSPVSSSRQGSAPIEFREKRSNTTSLTTPEAPTLGVLPTDKRASLPNVSQHQYETEITTVRRHRRLGSDDLKSVRADRLLAVNVSPDSQFRLGSCPSSPRSKHQTLPYPCPSNHQPIIHRTSLQHPTTSTLKDRQRSWSDLRSSSPQKLLPSFTSPPSTKPSNLPGVVTTSPHQQPIFTTGGSCGGPIHRPGPLDGLKQPKAPHTSSHDVGSNSPGSPNVTITPAEDGVSRQLGLQYDSGKDSMTCSDHSNGSESQPDLIKLDNEQQQQLLKVGSGYHLAEFDPLLTIKPSVSNDSLFESQTKTVSPTPTPSSSTQHQHQHQQWGSGTPAMQRQGSGSSVILTSPKSFSQDTLKQSLSHDSGILPSPSIARPRPKAMNLPQVPAPPLPISAPSSRPPSPKPPKSFKRNISPTPSVQSMRTYRYDSDPGWNDWSDSDATSTSSSVLDVRYEDGDPNLPTYDFEDFFNPSATTAFMRQ